MIFQADKIWERSVILDGKTAKDMQATADELENAREELARRLVKI